MDSAGSCYGPVVCSYIYETSSPLKGGRLVTSLAAVIFSIIMSSM